MQWLRLSADVAWCCQACTGQALSCRSLQVSNALKAARRQWHPDKHRSEPLEKQAYAEEMFKLLSTLQQGSR